MGRLQRKKFRTHASAAQSTASKSKSNAASVGGQAAVGAAAVAATFSADEDDGDDDDEPVDNEQSDDEDEDGQALSRGQRKRMKRRNAFMRKMGLVNRVVQEKEKQQRKATNGVFADIQELQNALFVSDKELAKASAGRVSQATNTQQHAGQQKAKKLSGKQRQKIGVREVGQLKAVHTHPSFKTDPFAAIQMHLQNTVVQANQAALQKTATATGKTGKSTKTAKKKANDMDVE
ncbi:hypothetical protein Poli38472_010551 [Pythium oligandrum]|uniref:Ribosome biogenesis protein SLX9 n=1 Tax=Pythium oligandrum TaxID=41045 RepID=A0A8K1C3C8_PYTOL|nr:hypothetical protein Poli38472_010551 [Pythium oligandrum]|eukprot:TMW55669.1 hypothetical protein Poli38472_010551 [Pythium oligandrum]